MSETEKLRALLDSIAEHRKRTQSGAPYSLCDAAWHGIAMRACEAEQALSRLLEAGVPGPLMTFSVAFLDSWMEDAPEEAKRHWKRVRDAAIPNHPPSEGE